MIGDCIERDEPFGVLLIREGNEVGEPAEPHAIGTTARVSQVQRLQEGRLNILTRGENPFRVAANRADRAASGRVGAFHG